MYVMANSKQGGDPVEEAGGGGDEDDIIHVEQQVGRTLHAPNEQRVVGLRAR